MLKLKIDKILFDRHMNPNQLSKLTGIRYPTILDMCENKSKAWSPDNLSRVMAALKITNVSELIEYVDESPSD